MKTHIDLSMKPATCLTLTTITACCSLLSVSCKRTDTQEANDAPQTKAPAKTWAHDDSDIKPDAKVIYGKLDNGMKYIIMRNEEPPERVSMRLHIAAGSLMEREDQRGVAHFLEHMVFNGSKNFPSPANTPP